MISMIYLNHGGDNMKNAFEDFDCGELLLPDKTIKFRDIPWSKHPSFEGVEIKCLMTFSGNSYNLVRIAPNMKIGEHIHANQVETHEVISGSGICINNGQELAYNCGVISVMEKGIPHEVTAGKDGLYMLAKFITV